MIEASDLNDGQILNATRQETNNSDQLRFSIVLPSGRKVTSEWIDRSKAKQAMFAWLETIKSQVVQDGEAKQEAARKARRDAALLSESAPTVSAGTDTPPTLATGRGRTEGADPFLYAERQLALAAAEVQHWDWTYKDAEQKLKKATAVRDKWARILSQLSGEDANV